MSTLSLIVGSIAAIIAATEHRHITQGYNGPTTRDARIIGQCLIVDIDWLSLLSRRFSPIKSARLAPTPDRQCYAANW